MIILVAAFQVAAVVLLAAQREWIVQFGDTVYLRTMPVDPRDIFRGDYVRLDYEISRLPRKLWADDLKNHPRLTSSSRSAEDLRVFTVLKKNSEGLGQAVRVTSQRPESGFFVRGRIDWYRENVIRVNYSLEALFVEQGKGIEIEKKRGRGEEMRIPMEVEVGVGENGLGVIKGYRWSPVGLGLQIDRGEDGQPIRARLSLLNASEEPLAVVDLPRGQSYELRGDFRTSYRRNQWRWVGRKDRPRTSQEDIVVLQPKETHETVINFNNPDWFIRKRGRKISLSEDRERNWQRFRFIYRPPPPSKINDLQNSERVYNDEILSAAFRGARVD